MNVSKRERLREIGLKARSDRRVLLKGEQLSFESRPSIAGCARLRAAALGCQARNKVTVRSRIRVKNIQITWITQ